MSTRTRIAAAKVCLLSKIRAARVLGVAAVLWAAHESAPAQVMCARPAVRLTPPAPTSLQSVGDDVALRGNVALVGARGRSAVSVFESGPGGWTHVVELSGQDTVAGDWFGAAIDFDGATAVIGAQFDDDQGNASGAAYVFVRNGSTWTQQAKLLPPTGAALDNFGSSVAIEGDRLVVGSVKGDGAVADTGTAHVFERTAGVWSWVARLQLPDGIAGEGFGFEVAIDGERIVVGAPDDGDGPINRGSASLFERSGGAWPLTARLRSNNASNSDFGQALEIVGSQILVGGPDDSTLGNQAGGLWVYELQGGIWVESSYIVSIDIAAGDHFGADLDFDGERLAIGAWGDDDAANGFISAGAVYLFEQGPGGWTQRHKLSSGATNSNTSMGWSVACDGANVLAGAPSDNLSGTGAGTCFAFGLVLAPQAYCTAQVNSLGCVPVVTATGVPTASGLVPFDLHATSLINRRTGLMAYSLAGPHAVPLNGGWQCLRAPFRRLPPQGTRGSPNGVDCTGFLDFDFAEHVRSHSDPALVGGAQVWIQFWSRDPGAPSSLNSTSALAFELCNT